MFCVLRLRATLCSPASPTPVRTAGLGMTVLDGSIAFAVEMSSYNQLILIVYLDNCGYETLLLLSIRSCYSQKFSRVYQWKVMTGGEWTGSVCNDDLAK